MSVSMPSPRIVLRLVRPSDGDALAALVRTFHEKVQPPYTFEASLMGLVRSTSWVWLVERDGDLVGYCWLTAKGPRAAFVEQAYLEPGIRLPAKALEDLAHKMGVVVLETIVLREGWKRLMQHWGFHPTGVVMEKVIAPKTLVSSPEVPVSLKEQGAAGATEEAT